jgi:hypothetical protein
MKLLKINQREWVLFALSQLGIAPNEKEESDAVLSNREWWTGHIKDNDIQVPSK